MDLSVIIPCHNLENFITPMLDSLNSQKLYDYKVELIFICDSCTDKTRSVIENYTFTNCYAKGFIYECEVHSAGLARNYGLEKAVGKYVWFLDGDDWLIDDNAFSVVIHLFNLYESMGNPYEMMRISFDSSVRFGDGPAIWQFVFLRDLIKDLRFPSNTYGEDFLFLKDVEKEWHEMHNTENDIDIICLPKPLYYYNYLREGSITSQHKDKMIVTHYVYV